MIALPLTRGAAALIDDDDFELVGRLKWCCHSQGYAVRSVFAKGRRNWLSMHRVIMDCPPGLEVDHINGDRLDNRRENLRVCTRGQNARNRRRHIVTWSSRFKGVCHLRNMRWQASITLNGRIAYLGSFTHEIDAALAYDRAALEHFGEFARTNLLRMQNA